MPPHSTKPDDQYRLPDVIMDRLNEKHPLIQLAKEIDWEDIEKDFAIFYCDSGRRAMPIRTMVALLLLKQMYDLSDRRLMEMWCENPYWQKFSGIANFQTRPPCDRSDLTYFRKRIGEAGVNKILQISVKLHGKSALESEIIVDSTVQTKAIAFPTDTRLCLKVIWRSLKLARQEQVCLRRSFTTELKGLTRIARFEKSKANAENALRAKERIRVIARCLVTEIRKKLNRSGNHEHDADLDLYKRVVNQNKDDTGKVYSLHEPEVACIAKGKAHVEYEFGSKASIALTSKSGIIVGALCITDNRSDSRTLPAVIEQVSEITGKKPKTVLADRGYRGHPEVKGVDVIIPDAPRPEATAYEKRKLKAKCGRRCTIEPVIGHLKSGYGMVRNRLKGIRGDITNIVLAATAFNLRKWMRMWAERPFCAHFRSLYVFMFSYRRPNLNVY